jgi:hypothetical protein
MKAFSRRKFISAGAISSLGAIAGVSSCNNGIETRSVNISRNNPLDGITRENIKITDMKVTLLSCELSPEEQWYL